MNGGMNYYTQVGTEKLKGRSMAKRRRGKRGSRGDKVIEG